jgi:hypothetical protein
MHRLPSRPAWILAGFLAGTLTVTLIRRVDGDRAQAEPAAELPPKPDAEAARPNAGGRVDAVMRNVRYLVDEDIALGIVALRGALLPAGDDSFPVFDDPASFVIEVADGEVAIDTASLGRLLTRYVFAYEGSSLRDLRVSVKDGEIVQKGKLDKGIRLPFTIQSRLSVTPRGEIRLEPHKVEVLGMGVRRFMDLIGLELEDLVRSNRARGVRIEEDIVYLNPSALLPPPALRGRLRQVRVEPGGLVQVFGDGVDSVPRRKQTNFMHFRHSRLRFGKLTMHDADMLILDPDPGTPLEFSLDRYHAQLVAGYHVTTGTDGLVVYLPDASRVTGRIGGATPRRSSEQKN